MDGSSVVARHRPTKGTAAYSLEQKAKFTECKFKPTAQAPYVASELAAYADLLNRCLTAKLSNGIYRRTLAISTQSS